MASVKSKSAIVVRKAPTVPKKKYEHLIEVRKRASAKAKDVAKRRMGVVVGAAAAGAVGYLEKSGKMPNMGGFEPTVVLGVALGLVAPEFVKGDAGHMVAEAGAALVGVAAYKLASGTPLRVSGDEDWSPV